MFLGIFAATMLVQFVVQFFDSVADIYGEPGKRDTSIQMGAISVNGIIFSCISVRYDGICSWIRLSSSLFPARCCHYFDTSCGFGRLFIEGEADAYFHIGTPYEWLSAGVTNLTVCILGC